MSSFLGKSRTLQEGRSSTSNITDIVSNPFLNRITTRGSGSNSSNKIVQIEDEINIDRNLELYNTNQLDSLKNEERISAYSSGNFGKIGQNWTSLDFEIQALINSLEKFKIYLNNEFTVRTDCEAIVKFLRNDNSRKVNRTRWVNLQNLIQGKGYTINFEHIKGKDNSLADLLSRNIYKYLDTGYEQ